MFSFLLSLLTFLNKLFDQLTYIEGLQEGKKTPEYQYNENIEKLNTALADGDASGVAAITEQLRPDKNNDNSGLPRSGSPSP